MRRLYIVVNKTKEDFEGRMKQMWEGTKGALGKQAGEAGTAIITSRAQIGKMVFNSINSTKGKRGAPLIVEHYRKIATPTANGTLDAGLKKEINAWAEANVDA